MFSSITAITAILTTIMSVGVKVIGMPDQIKSNYRRKSTEGLSSWFLVCTLLSYGLWVVHGFQVHDMSLVIGQSLGVVVSAVLVGQMWAYRKVTPPEVKAKPVTLWLQALRFKTAARQDHKKVLVKK
jgi:uncharacterized protein with PQ loop repeat